MAKTLLFSFLTATCIALAAPQAAIDAPGVTVALNGSEVLHRTGIGYPPAALRNGIQGTVAVEVRIDSNGEVSDAQVLSGPEELRKGVLTSVLNWHFTPDFAGTSRMIQVDFTAPKTAETLPVAVPAAGSVQTGTIRSIEVQDLSAEGRAQLLAALPIHEGDQWNPDSAERARQALKAFDEHLSIRQQTVFQSPDGGAQVDLVISNLPKRIRVGGNLQSAMIVRKVVPLYPPEAKAAGIQGIVSLAAIIGKDGTMQELKVLDGPPQLIQAAMDAVKQWVYQPTLLNGNPVQVETTIDVNFTLAK